MNTSHTASTGSAFRLEDLSAKWGVKLWTLTFDLPGEKVNKLNESVMADFGRMLDRIEQMGTKGEIDVLVLRSAKPGIFIAGADIKVIESIKTEEQAIQFVQAGHEYVNRWEDLPFPTVAAVNGAALGGGCEMALASTAIVMSDDSGARIGLPEVLLGIVPGLGGCVRLPRKVGIATALDLILTGKALTGERAYKAGLIEALVHKENFDEYAQKWVVSKLADLKSGRRLAREPKLGGMGGAMGKLLEGPLGRGVVYKKAREGVMKQTKGHYPAPLEAIRLLQDNGAAYGPKVRGKTRAKMLARESKAFGKLAVTDISGNLIRIFFMTEDVKKSNGLPPGNTVTAKPVQLGGVLGAGVMGGGVAQLFAAKEIPTEMKDITPEALTIGVQSANKLFKKDLKRRKINRRDYLRKLGFIAPTLSYASFKGVDYIVEAVVEKMEVKKSVFQELENHIDEECVVTSNTSSLSITEMQTVFKRPERFAGMHFFNPVHRMPLVEVIRGAKTSDETVATVYELCKRLGKTPIVVKDGPGFLVNRLLVPYMNEATHLLSDGAPIPDIDKTLLKFGMPMGPMELLDEVGLDVGEKVAKILHGAFGDRMLPAATMGRVVQSGRFGKKNGKGIYTYTPIPKQKDRYRKVLDPKIYEILGVTPSQGAVSPEEMVDRCVLPMINEASRCLEEGIVASPAEVDLGMIMGTGFPPFRGGLLKYADSLGPKEIVERLRKYEKRFGVRYEPAPPLLRRAEQGRKFYPEN